MYENYEAVGTDQYFSGIDSAVLANFDLYLSRCHDYLDTAPHQPRLLDVGCGKGAFLERAQQAQFLCEGVEICEPLADAAAGNLGCPIHRSLLSNLDLDENSFDVITMYDLIEHLPEPASDIEKVHKWLRPGGILFILTPNDNALLRHIARFMYRGSFRTIDRPMRVLYYSHHLSYFSSASLTRLVEGHGFEIVEIETRNQETSRLILSPTERLAVRLTFAVADRFSSMGGKLVMWARKNS